MILGQDLGQIMSLIFFHVFLGEYLIMQKAVVVKPPERKFMATIARNVKF